LFLEAPFPPDNLDAYRRFGEHVNIRIATGDWGFTTRFEYMDLMDRGGVGVVQPSTVRSGGIAEIIKIAEIGYRKGLLCMTPAWAPGAHGWIEVSRRPGLGFQLNEEVYRLQPS
jgi:L-alanine-DL-glutamate epimerase-like enolase superfamily enzyme